MGGKRKRSGKTNDQPRLKARDSASSRESVKRGSAGGLGTWVRTNRSDLRFLLIFGLCLGLYYASTVTPVIKHGFFPAYLRANAQASGAILGFLGQDVTVKNQSIISSRGPAIEIERGCDAVEPSALFVSAVLASPVPVLSRLSAAMLGTLALMLLNLARVVSLFLVRVYYPSAFQTMHLDVWQVLFIVFAIVLWAMWASRMARKLASHGDSSA